MFILGLLAFIQTTWLPGYLLLKYTKWDMVPVTQGKTGNNRILTLIHSFALSLLINYLAVFALTAAGIYRPAVLYAIFGIEVLLLFYYLAYRSENPDPLHLNLDLKRYAADFKTFTTSNSFGFNVLFVAALMVTLWYVFLVFYFMGDVFEHWDPVVGWNRFAIDWAANRFPIDTFRYPQLIPSNWSVSYVFMQATEVQCFAKSIMGLFPLGICLLFIHWALETKKSVYLLAVLFFGGWITYLFEPSFIVSGYVDIAISFFAILAFYNLCHSDRRRGFLAIVFASAAGVTKQGGLFFFAFMLLWVFIRWINDYIRSKKTPTDDSQPVYHGFLNPRSVGFIAIIFITAMIIIAPWYVKKEIDIRGGKDISEISVAQSANTSTDIGVRFTNAMREISIFRNPKLRIVFNLALVIMCIGLFHKKSRTITGLVSIPYFLLWACFFSYDSRNLAHVIPFMAYSSAYGIEFYRRFLPVPEKLKSYRISIVPLVIAVFMVILFAGISIIPGDVLRNQQIEKTKKIGDSELNDLLYDYHKKHGLTGKILTNYQYLKYLPELKSFYKFKPGRLTVEYLNKLNTPGEQDVHYLMMPSVMKSEKDVLRFLEEKIASKEFSIVFRHRGYHFIKVR